jgi:hypothetical protein
VSATARASVAGVVTAVCLLGLLRPAEAQGDEDDQQEARWPVESILRPQTLPRGMFQLDITGQGTIPNHRDNVDPVSHYAYQFYPAFQLGLSLAGGVTDRLQLDIGYPRVLCLSQNQPSACDPTNHFGGAGGGATYGFLRRDRVQGAISGELQVERSSPLELQWSVSAWFKLTAPPRLAFSLTVSAQRAINPPVQDLAPWTYGQVDLGLTVQAMRRLAVYADLIPWAPVGRVGDGVALEVHGGGSYTVSRELQIGVEWGSSNVMSNPSWNQMVPAWFVNADLVWWVDWEVLA